MDRRSDAALRRNGYAWHDMLGSAASQPATVLQLTSVAEQLGKRSAV